MSLKHLAKGSICPQLTDGVLRVYNMRFCPYAQRTLIVLKAKNIQYEVVNIHLKNRPDWFYEKNPLGKVPTLEQNGKLMIESLVTSDYLNEAYPNPPLYPTDPWSKAVDKGLIEVFGVRVVSPFLKLFFFHDSIDKEAIAAKLNENLKLFEIELNKRGSKFFGGEKPGMLDYMMWPFIERLPLVNFISKGKFDLVSVDYLPKMYNYIQELSKHEAVASTIIPIEQHIEFLSSFSRGEPNYDHGL